MSDAYSDEVFSTTVDEIESLLGDLYGIEMASEAILDFAYRPGGEGSDVNPKITRHLTLPVADSFTVYPMLPDSTDSSFDYQTWVDAIVESGKLKAAATGAWLKSLADNYYLVDAAAITDAAQSQSLLMHQQGVIVNASYAELNGNLAVHWEGDAKEEFVEWFTLSSSVASALMWYADSAALSAGAAGDVIAATQKQMLAQVQHGRDALKKAVDTWREDNDVFPFPPGSGYTLEQLNAFISSHVDEYVDQIPAGGTLLKIGVGQVLKKFPAVRYAKKGYDFLVKLDAGDTDPQTPESAETLIGAIETGLTDICTDGDTALEKLAAAITPLAADLAGDDALVLPRLPRDPQGSYQA